MQRETVTSFCERQFLDTSYMQKYVLVQEGYLKNGILTDKALKDPNIDAYVSGNRTCILFPVQLLAMLADKYGMRPFYVPSKGMRTTACDPYVPVPRKERIQYPSLAVMAMSLASCAKPNGEKGRVSEAYEIGIVDEKGCPLFHAVFHTSQMLSREFEDKTHIPAGLIMSSPPFANSLGLFVKALQGRHLVMYSVHLPLQRLNSLFQQSGTNLRIEEAQAVCVMDMLKKEGMFAPDCLSMLSVLAYNRIPVSTGLGALHRAGETLLLLDAVEAHRNRNQN